MGLAQQSRSAQSAALGSVFGALGGALIGSAGSIGSGGSFSKFKKLGGLNTRKEFNIFKQFGKGQLRF
jgi:hypothetical protein